MIEVDPTTVEVMRFPCVSVISIFYNEAKYISEAIDSVLAQDFRDFELFLVDDGSSDGSSGIAREYAARDPKRVRYLEHPDHANSGMSTSRNLGLAEARGEFVAFIDADDRWRPSKLTEQVEIISRLPAVDAVGGSVNYWKSHSGGKDRVVPTGHVRDRPIPPGQATTELYPLGRAQAPSMSDLLLRRSSIAKIGGFEESFTGAYEDQAFLAKFYLECTLYLTNSVWSDYRIHSESCMAKAHRDGAYRHARRSFLVWFESYLSHTRLGRDAAIKRALNRALRRGEHASRRRRIRAALRAVSPKAAISLARAGKSAFQRLRPRLMPGAAILMYHRIADEGFDPWGLAVSPRNFSDQLEWISRNRTVFPLVEFVGLHQSGDLPRDAVAVTFDDGYACNGDIAVPLLKCLGIPATIFIPTELIERQQEFWWDELQTIVLDYQGEVLRLDGHAIHVGEKHLADADWPPAQPPTTPRQLAYRQLWSLLYERMPYELDKGMAQLREQASFPVSPRKSHRPMTSDEVRSIRSDLVAFGSHTLNHASLPLLDPQEKLREIRESFERCAALTGAEPYSFAYPYGDFDVESEAIVAQAGYLCACKADGWFVGRRTSRFALPRIFVGNWDSARLARQLGRP